MSVCVIACVCVCVFVCMCACVCVCVLVSLSLFYHLGPSTFSEFEKVGGFACANPFARAHDSCRTLIKCRKILTVVTCSLRMGSAAESKCCSACQGKHRIAVASSRLALGGRWPALGGRGWLGKSMIESLTPVGGIWLTRARHSGGLLRLPTGAEIPARV